MGKVFVTGMYRSGTTLVDKVLSNHPDVFVASQPMPYIFIEAKLQFYDRLISLSFIDNYAPKNEQLLPLNHLYHKPYTFAQLDAALDEIVLSGAELLQKHRDSGLSLSPFLQDVITELPDGTPAEVWHEVNRQLAQTLKPAAQVVGSKEIVAEEFIPHLLAHDSKIILVLREPRRVLLSLNYGQGSDWTGDIRPTLFNLQVWRKSAAYAYAYRNHDQVFVLRLEDLTSPTRQQDTLNELWAFLEIEPPDNPINTLQLNDQTGVPWAPNTSFPEEQRPSLPTIIEAYLQALTSPELEYLKYPQHSLFSLENCEAQIADFQEPFAVNHALFDESYSHSERWVNFERERRSMVGHRRLIPQAIERLFIFESVKDLNKQYYETI